MFDNSKRCWFIVYGDDVNVPFYVVNAKEGRDVIKELNLDSDKYRCFVMNRVAATLCFSKHNILGGEPEDIMRDDILGEALGVTFNIRVLD